MALLRPVKLSGATWKQQLAEDSLTNEWFIHAVRVGGAGGRTIRPNVAGDRRVTVWSGSLLRSITAIKVISYGNFFFAGLQASCIIATLASICQHTN
jgi:hypothetical protein